MDYKNQTIWIIGCSSGIGLELAMLLDGYGANLILSARRKNELEKLNKSLTKNHQIVPLDITNYDELKKSIKNIKNIDRVIFMPALYRPDSIENMEIEFTQKMLEVNIMGAFNLTHLIIPLFKKQKKGQIALCGSVAGYTGLPNGQPYSATKAAIINFAESLNVETPDYIDVKLISPGFVKTPMTDKNDFEMPMIITAKQAAKFIVKGLNSRKFEIDFPKKFTIFLKLIRLLPYSLKFLITKNMAK